MYCIHAQIDMFISMYVHCDHSFYCLSDIKLIACPEQTQKRNIFCPANTQEMKTAYDLVIEVDAC